MRFAICILMVIIAFASVAFAAEPNKVTLQAQAISLQEAITQLSTQSGVSIVLDPEAKGTVTASLQNVELSQALNVISQPNNLIWKKLQFASSENTPVTLDQIKSAIIALKAMPIIAFAVEDPKTGAKTVYSKDIPASSNVPELPLSEGYTWKTVYVVFISEPVASSTTSAGGGDVNAATDAQVKRTMDLAQLTPEQRRQVFSSELTAQMTLVPEARRELFRDQLFAIFDLSPENQKQYFNDMGRAMRDARNVRKQMGLPEPNIRMQGQNK